MTDQKLAFLQNFYTDITLYVPVEPPTTPVPAPPPVAAAQLPERKLAAAATMPSRSYSNPTAGLERLASGFHQPLAAPVEDPVPQPLAAPVPAPGVPAVPPAMLTPFSVLGQNTQGVILLFRLPSDQFLKLHRNVFLNKMLQALDLAMDDVLLVNIESDLPVALVNLRRQLAATHVVAFGKNLLDTTIRNTQIYEPVQFPNLGLCYLSSATVELVEYDVSLKKRLWPGLKRMFMQ